MKIAAKPLKDNDEKRKYALINKLIMLNMPLV